ncbi:MAG: NPCBM/NEW2 domain-containing protein [Clostridiales bacterium]|jgi:hypothetical protein|nr:NPCBM/NEW2 domain-containing protein [Clostridiales bacterium]
MQFLKRSFSLFICFAMFLSAFAVTAQAATAVKIGKYASDAVFGGEFSWHLILKGDSTFELVTNDFEGTATMTGTWTSDGAGNVTVSITNGAQVVFSGGGSDVLTLTVWPYGNAFDNTPLYYDTSYTAQPPGQTANPTASTVYVNGTAKAFEAYNIGGSNYFKLRDIAAVFNGTTKQFDVGYDSATAAITLASAKPYALTGSELAQGDGIPKTATATASKIYLDGRQLDFTVYNIAGSNFFKLVDLMSALNVGVTYNEKTGEISLDTSANYTGVITVSGGAPTQPQAASAVNLIDTMKPYAYTDLGNYVDYVLWYPSAGEASLALAGESYKNALALHESPADVYASFNLGGKYAQINGKVGMADAGGRYVSDPPVTVRIYGDGQLLKTMEIKMGALPVDLSLDVHGVSTLKFEVAPQTLYRATVIGFVDLVLK